MLAGGVDMRVEFVRDARKIFPCLGGIDSRSTVSVKIGVFCRYDCEEDYKNRAEE